MLGRGTEVLRENLPQCRHSGKLATNCLSHVTAHACCYLIIALHFFKVEMGKFITNEGEEEHIDYWWESQRERDH
jgi:hypothetical protein